MTSALVRRLRTKHSYTLFAWVSLGVSLIGAGLAISRGLADNHLNLNRIIAVPIAIGLVMKIRWVAIYARVVGFASLILGPALIPLRYFVEGDLNVAGVAIETVPGAIRVGVPMMLLGIWVIYAINDETVPPKDSAATLAVETCTSVSP